MPEVRLIDANELKRLIESGDDLIFDTATERELMHMIDYQPTIKPEVRHGRWMNTNETVWDAKEIDGKQQIEISIVAAQCSVCGRWAEEVNNTVHRMLSKYCHWCGAIMDAKPPEGSAGNG